MDDRGAEKESSFSAPRSSILKFQVTIQSPPNQLANIDFDVIGTSDYELMEK